MEWLKLKSISNTLGVCLLFLGIGFLFGAATPAQAETCTWTASTSQDMGVSTNWDAGTGGAACTLSPDDTFVFGSRTSTNANWGEAVTSTAGVTISNGYTGTITVTTTAATTTGNFTQNAGAVVFGGSVFEIGGDWAVGTSTQFTTGTIKLSGASKTISGSLPSGTLYNITILNGASATLGFNATISGVFTVDSGGTLNLGSATLTLPGTGTPLVVSGTFNGNTGTVTYSGATANIATTTFYNLNINSATGASLNGNITVSSTLTVLADKTLNAGAFSITLTKDTGTPFAMNGTFNGNTGTVTYSGTSANIASSTYYNLTVNNEGTLLANTTVSSTLTVNSSKTLNIGANTLSLTGTGTPLVVNGTFNGNTGTVTYSGATANIASSTYYNLVVNNATSGTLTGSTTVSSTLTINASKTLNASSYTLTFTSSSAPFVINGTFTSSSSTVQYTNVGSVTPATTTYWALTLGAGTYAFSYNTTSTDAFTNGGTLTIDSGKTLEVLGAFDNNGTITETGAIKHPLTSSKLTDSSGTEVSSYNTGSGNVYINVVDGDGNLDTAAVDTITGTVVTASGYSDSETITLTETGVDTGIFRSSVLTFLVAASKTNNSSKFEVSGDGTLTLAFTDSKDSTDTGSDTASFTGNVYTYSGNGGGGGGGGVPAPVIPVVPITTTTPTIPTDPSLPTTPTTPTSPSDSVVEPESKKVVLLKPLSKVVITPPSVVSYQPGDKLKFTYKYVNDSGKKINIKVVRQLLDSEGKVVKTSQATAGLNKNNAFSRKVDEVLAKTLKPGNYTARVRVYNSAGKLLDENSFKIKVEKLKVRYVTFQDILSTESDILFDGDYLSKIKANTKLPATFKLRYAYTNNSGTKHTIKMTRELVDKDGKIINSKSGKWIMDKGEKDSLIVNQTFASNFAAGTYSLRIRAYDWTTKDILAENSLNLDVELR